jgi:hypothetical protein
MNNKFLLAWMDDWQMSARLAKFSTSNSYELIFCENGLKVPKDAAVQSVLIIDVGGLKEEEFRQITQLQDDDLVFIIAYDQEVDGSQIKYFRELGCDMVLKRNKLLKNLEKILQKIINAD